MRLITAVRQGLQDTGCCRGQNMPAISTIDQMQHVWLSQIDYVKPATKVSLCDKAPVLTEKRVGLWSHFTVTFSIIPSFLVAA